MPARVFFAKTTCMAKKLLFVLLCATTFLYSCKKESGPVSGNEEAIVPENPASFKQNAVIDLGGVASAEISAYDPLTKRLFVVNNEGLAKVDVIDMAQYPAVVSKTQSIDVSAFGFANSVAVYNGVLAIALEAKVKQDNGSIGFYSTSTLAQTKLVAVGALPDMVTFSPDGRYVVSANEGEPNDAYTNDPNGTVSIIDTKNNYAVKTLDFSGLESAGYPFFNAGYRVFGPNATVAKDTEPEYVSISPDSKTAYVTLQENNAVAEINLISGSIVKVVPLGAKDISLAQNAFDVSDRDNKIQLNTWPIKAYYLPDAVSYFAVNRTGYYALANEGDTRAYTGYNEEVRVKDLKLDATVFPNATVLKQDANLGRLTVTKASGDTDKDGDYDELYATGGRSVTIHEAATGKSVAEIGKDMEERVIAAGKYDDTRSDNKGVEPEAVTVHKVNGQTIAFIGMERADMIAVYDVSKPASPVFLQLFETGDAPEGVLYIKPKDSPNGRSIIVVSCEEDGTVHFYQPDKM